MAEHYKQELTRRLEAAIAAFDRRWEEVGSECPAVLSLAQQLFLPAPFAERMRGEIDKAVHVLRQPPPPPVPGGTAEDGEARLAAGTRVLQLLACLEEPQALLREWSGASLASGGGIDDGVIMWASHGVWRFPSSDRLPSGMAKEPPSKSKAARSKGASPFASERSGDDGRGGGTLRSEALTGGLGGTASWGGPAVGACAGDGEMPATDLTQYVGEVPLALRVAVVLGKADDEALAAALQGHVTEVLEQSQQFAGLFQPPSAKTQGLGESCLPNQLDEDSEDADDGWWQPPGFEAVDQPLAPEEPLPPPTPPRTPTPPPSEKEPEPDIVVGMRLHGISMDDAQRTAEARLSEKLAALVAKECGIPREWVSSLTWGPPAAKLPPLDEASSAMDPDEVETIGRSETGSRIGSGVPRSDGMRSSIPRSSIAAAA